LCRLLRVLAVLVCRPGFAGGPRGARGSSRSSWPRRVSRPRTATVTTPATCLFSRARQHEPRPPGRRPRPPLYWSADRGVRANVGRQGEGRQGPSRSAAATGACRSGGGGEGMRRRVCVVVGRGGGGALRVFDTYAVDRGGFACFPCLKMEPKRQKKYATRDSAPLATKLMVGCSRSRRFIPVTEHQDQT
jgi:hypothetical protein